MSQLTAADYCDWCKYAGLYLHNVSHADRYRTYEVKVSKAGLFTKIVFDFLESNKGGLDLQTWRNSDVYEIGDDAAYRIEQTALALAALGARRTADKIRTLRDTSLGGMLFNNSEGDVFKSLMGRLKDIDPAKMMEEFRANVARAMPDVAAQGGMPIPEKKPIPVDADVETREQIEHLLELYVQAHTIELQSDLAKHGDPRQAPGFDPDKRLAELDRLRRADADCERQRDDLPEARKLMDAIEQQIAKNPKLKPGKVAKPRREFLQHYRTYHGRPANDLLPEMQAWLKEAAAFQEKHAAIFRPRPINDDTLLKRLLAIGAYDVDMGTKRVQLSWDNPAGIDCDWTTFSMTMKYPIGDKKSLKALLDAYDRMVKRFSQHQADLRGEVLQSFDIHREFIARMGYDGYEVDDDGNPTGASIFKNAGPGGIHLSIGGEEDGDGDDIAIQVYFSVEWDQEHGLDLGIIDEPEVEPAAPDAPLPTNLLFTNSGPALTEQRLGDFEAKYDLKLPAEYRSVLLRQNGGEVQPNHLKVKFHGGASMPIYVDKLYAILGGGADDDLGNTLEMHRANELPDNYLPIGRVRMTGDGASAPAELMIGLKGKKAGKLLAAQAPSMEFAAGPDQMADMMAMMFEQFLAEVAPGMNAFLSRLTPPPAQTIPMWLDAIRTGDTLKFLGWLQAKGKLTEQHIPYGEFRMLDVLDYLALEAPPDMLKSLLDAQVINPNQLRSRWQRWDLKLKRLRELLPILRKGDLCYAFLAADVWDDEALLNELLVAGVDLDGGIDEEGATPLHFAIRNRRPDGVRWLLAHGASPSKPDSYGRTGLVWAESEHQLESLKLLLEAGEKIESLFPHMPTLKDKLRLIKSRWFGEFDALAEYLRGRGVKVEV